MNLTGLQNGSDIRGIAVSTDKSKANLTDDIAAQIAFSFVHWLKEEKNIEKPVIAVGRDSRITGEALSKAIVKGLFIAGASKVYDAGLASTPAMYGATKADMLGADAAVMITASHLPYDRNGMKFFTKQGGLNKNDIEKILKFNIQCNSNTIVDKYAEKIDLIGTYSESLVALIRQKTALNRPLEGLKIIVDAGNGAGGFFVDNVLTTLGANTKGSVFLEPDGMFPNHIPNPENPRIMSYFSKKVQKQKADLGVIFDTDVDRAAIVDENGEPIARSKLIALMSHIVLFENPGATIVTDSVTSNSLKAFIELKGGTHHRFKRGYNNVISEAIRLNSEGIDCPIAIETSGHCALRENGFTDDGAYLIVKILIFYSELRKHGQTLADALKDYADPAESIELRPVILEKDFRAFGEKLLAGFREFALNTPGWTLEEPNYEGVRVNCDKTVGNGWALMRMSLHEPQIPINIESDEVYGSGKIKDKIMQFLSEYKYSLKIEEN